MFFKRDSQDAKTLVKDNNPFKKIENHLNKIVEVPEIQHSLKERTQQRIIAADLNFTKVTSKKRKAKDISNSSPAVTTTKKEKVNASLDVFFSKQP